MVKETGQIQDAGGRKKSAKANSKIATMQMELIHVDSEIEKLVDNLIGANDVLISYENVKIAELNGCKQELPAQIAELTVEDIIENSDYRTSSVRHISCLVTYKLSFFEIVIFIARERFGKGALLSMQCKMSYLCSRSDGAR